MELNSEDQQKLDKLFWHMKDEADHMVGFPATRTLDYSPLYPFFDFLLNNIGDPYSDSAYRLNTHDIECEVVAWFKDILKAENHNVWGYVTNGGTEGNLYGAYLARELYPNGMVYFSEGTHYSVAKILRLVNSRSIMIKSQPNGEMDYDDLAKTISVHRDVPPIIFANIGTTMKGAIDNLDKIKDILKDHAIVDYYIHADAALSGMILPFVDEPQPFTFDSGIDSIAISGHKMPGAPIPCGVVLAKQDHVDRVSKAVEYIGSRDTTVSGSRNGVTPLFLWYAIKVLGKEGFHDMVHNCLEVADYALAKLQEAKIDAWRHKNSVTVVFPRFNDKILKKWQIATHHDAAHLIAMPHVSKEKVDNFIEELLAAEQPETQS